MALELPATRDARRFLASHLGREVGLEHLAYNAHTGDRGALDAVASRLAPYVQARLG